MSQNKLRDVLSGMTFRQKVDHIWTYYKWLLAPIALAVLLISFVANIISNSRTEILYSGALVNVQMSDEGISYLSDQWFDALDGEEDTQRVDLMLATFNATSNLFSAEMDVTSSTKVIAAITACELDYVLTDFAGLGYCMSSAAFAPLTDILPEDMLVQLQGQFIYQEDDTGTYPVAINITQSAFVQDCITGTEQVFLAFPATPAELSAMMIF